ncbi:hypothetical protein Pan181_01380 [Aeoliella mucimassa]|uniref:Uncharacterized protein n=1 Tax=Aeoliella mucimassa TaxID=2527972 RepID=A0A518AGY1_9BACT|nr:hypothetical protein Pan181_01380 [Aeoliella mucimassa]
MQLIAHKRLAILSQWENRFPSDAFWGMGIYSWPKTAGFAECVPNQFSHRWVNWESIRERWETIRISAWGRLLRCPPAKMTPRQASV